MASLLKAQSLIDDSSYFDGPWYAATYPDVARSGMSAAEHYLKVGGFIGRNPGPAFDSQAYLDRYLDVAARRDNPLWHYEMHGRGEGRQVNPDPAASGAPPAVSVDVVVPVYNALEDVQACLNALADVPGCYPVQVLVINDGSDAPTSAWLREVCSDQGQDEGRGQDQGQGKGLSQGRVRFRLIEHEDNQGYTRAVNTGLRASEAPYVVTLNSDTIVTPFWLDGMIACLQSDARLGIVGPLSNAASWQNVPALYGPDGQFGINALPEGMRPADMAGIVRRVSRRSYPRTTFVNGFCFMLRRAVLEAVGYMDEAAFPTGYGEENDFCIRAQDAGFGLAYVDDVYVFHAKSKSFGTERRKTLSKAGSEAIKAKHGAAKFADLVAQVAETELMDNIRANVARALKARVQSVPERSADLVATQRVLFVLPVRGGGGGAHSVVQEVSAMQALGVTARVAVRQGDLDDYMRLYGDIAGAEDLFAPFADNELVALAQGYDVVVATIFTSVKLVAEVVAACPWVLPAYYAQDYEPLFFEEGDALRAEALASYTAIPGALVFAKTHWICRTIAAHHDVEVQKVEPSIDHGTYSLTGPRLEAAEGALCVSAMIRPRTPRRGAGRTMDLLARIKAHLGARVVIRIFGCDVTGPEFQALEADFEYIDHGVLTRPEVATVLRSSDMFIDLSDYQAFGRTGLEAMACGVVPVVPEAGGAREYAVDGINALVVDTLDVEGCLARILPLLRAPADMARMQLDAIGTAAGYSPRRAAMSELLTFAPAIAAWRETHAVVLNRPRVTVLPDAAGQEGGRAQDEVPGRGSGRLPAPYLHPTLLSSWDIRKATGMALPAPGSSEIAFLQGAAPARDEDTFAAWSAAWTAGGGALVWDLGEATEPEAIARPLLAGASVITVADAAAEARVEAYAPELAARLLVVPSYLDRTLWGISQEAPEAAGAPQAGPLRIGYLGTVENRSDFERIVPALQQIEGRFDVAIEVIGVYHATPPPVGRRIGYPRIAKTPGFSKAEFVAWLQQVATWDIVLLPDLEAPLEKFLRAAACKGALLCHDGPALRGFAEDGVSCLIADATQSAAWEAALSRLIEDTDLRAALCQTLQARLVQEWTSQAQTSLYHSVLERAFHARTPV